MSNPKVNAKTNVWIEHVTRRADGSVRQRRVEMDGMMVEAHYYDASGAEVSCFEETLTASERQDWAKSQAKQRGE